MPPRLDPEERERRRKARVAASFSDAAYKHYDPKTEGYGSADEWTGNAAERAGVVPVVEISADLRLLGLQSMPMSREALHAVYRKVSLRVHPDNGGSNDGFVAVRDAYDRLKDKYARKV